MTETVKIETVKTETIDIEAVKNEKKAQETIKKIDKKVIELLALLDQLQLPPAAENMQVGPTLRHALMQAKAKADWRKLPLRDRTAEHVKSMEANLERAKDTLAKFKKMSRATRYSLKGGQVGQNVPAEALERLQKRVERAKRNLAKARGTVQEYDKKQVEALRERKHLERLQEAEGQAAWQKRVQDRNARNAAEAANK